MQHSIFGTLYLITGLGVSAALVFRLYNMWSYLFWPQRALFLALGSIMFGFTQRGIELLFLDVPGPRPAAFFALTGGFVVLWSLLMPVDERLLPDWKDALKQQEPDHYERYMEILTRSQAHRKLDEEKDSA